MFILKLLIVHFLGDFTFQPNKWIKKRNKKGIASKYLYYHMLVHFVLSLLFFITELQKYFPGIVVIILLHYAIDVVKIYVCNKEVLSEFKLFLIDQFLHVLTIILVCNYYFPFEFKFQDLVSEKILLIITTTILIVSVTPIIIKVFFQRWENDMNFDSKESLKNAGLYIGIIERIFIVLFININFYEGIGYLLAAKSIFRFGDLTNAKDKKLTEYILLGTLLSFILAIVIGLILKQTLNS
ncbi:DUF3307 domain-containing protein [Flavobacterium terrigena]|uniref:DUF3307 domain-containing protein n=1 Tax=Flavobacterium terrigena TaxID=402734 RepID=UPI001C434F18|nr:DUF3307 domain-containing protein [Flavobacterium terrigena]